ncbi:MAG: LysR family transcriptional regulator [Ruminococcus sp.]|jgi:DNA-binding transcriptional LysR family regulator
MDIKNLITFIHVAELNSFTKAGETLGFSQSTVSFQIRQLEAELKVRLFERINHTVVLTEKGRKVLNYAYQIDKMTQELKGNIQHEENITGHVRIAMADSLCGFMVQGFRDFRRQYPGISLKITAAGTEEMLRLMNHNEADMILTLDTHVYHGEYVIAREEKVGMHFLSGPGCPLKDKSSVTVSQLLSCPFILTEKRMSYRRLLDEELARRSLEIQPVLEIGRTDLICTLVAQDIGITFLPDYVTEKEVKEGKLFRLAVDDFDIEIWKQLLHHRDKWVSPQMKAVTEYCIAQQFM